MAMGPNDAAGYMSGALSPIRTAPNAGLSAEGMVGSAMSGASAFGAPALQGIMGMAGIDPMSLGMNVGMKSFMAGGSLAGATASGLAVGGGVAIGLAGAGYMANQMYVGAQQQQQLNSAMRSSFNFATPQGYGFNRSDTANIGSNMRQMSQEHGPGGEMSSMRELTNIASKMGANGMATGIRDAQAFSDKMKSTVDALKKIATTLNTSLEGAMDFMQSSKGSGMFKAADQVKFANMGRETSVGSGVAMSEVSAMANIGSQISRSVGGLGKQGAFGGMKAIGQVGSALQTGALSEEDIYNATGATGAEGRQAMASNMMGKSAQFFSSGRGRRFLASVAGKDGQIDEASANEWMAGGMSTGRTSQLAQKNLSGVGRANFIRNEGRLRGAALEKFGALGQTMAYKEWLDSRGMDANGMDDRAMLGFQRFTGQGRDEADASIKMIQKLPEMLRDQRNRNEDDKYLQKMGQFDKTHGMEGVKNSFKQMREKLNSKLEEVGSTLYNDSTDYIESAINKMTGVTVSRASANIDQAYRAASLGGKDGMQSAGRTFGGGRRIDGSQGGDSGKRDTSSLARQMEKGGLMGFGDSAVDQMKKSGFDMSGAKGGEEDRGKYYQKRMQEVAKFQESAYGGDDRSTAFGVRNQDKLNAAYAGGSIISGKGEDRVKSYGKMLEDAAKTGDKDAQAELVRWKSDGANQAKMMASAEQGADINQKARLSGMSKTPDLMNVDRGKYNTVGEGDQAVGEALLGRKSKSRWDSTAAGAAAGATTGLFMGGGAGAVFGGAVGGAAGFLSGADTTGQSRAAGAFLRSDKGIAMASGLFARDGDVRRSAQKAAEKEMAGFNADKENGKLSAADEGRMGAMQGMLIGSSFAESGGAGMTGEKKEAYLKKVRGMSKDLAGKSDSELMSLGGKSYAVGTQELDAQQRENREEIRRKKQVTGEANLKGMAGMGVIARNEKTGKMELTSAATKGMDALTKAGMEDMLEATSAEARGDIGTAIQRRGRMQEGISMMTADQKKRAAMGGAGTDFGAAAGESLGREKRMAGSIKRRGVEASVGDELGLDLSKEELAKLKGLDSKGAADMLAMKLGTTDDKFVHGTKGKDGKMHGGLDETLDALRKGKTGKGADDLFKGLEQSGDAKSKAEENKQKKSEANDPMAKMARSIDKMTAAMEKLTPAAIGSGVATGLTGQVLKVEEIKK